MSNTPSETSRNQPLLQSAAILHAAAELLGSHILESHVTAIEAKAGMRISQPLLKLGLLCHWLGIEAHELEDACREQPVLGRFVSSSSYSPVVDLWVYQQLAPRMEAAALEFAELADAIEDELAVRGHLRRELAREAASTMIQKTPSGWAESTLIAASVQAALEAPLDEAELDAADVSAAQPDRGIAPGKSLGAMLLWPWGDAIDIDAPMCIGRDPEFSPYAHRLQDYRWVSRKHVVLEPSQNGVVVRDAGSSNGTRADQVRIGRSQSRLIDGDCVLHLGPDFACKIVFYPSAITA